MRCTYCHLIISISIKQLPRKCVCLCCLSLQVKLSVVFEYVRSLTWYMAILILLINLLANGLSVGGNFWLAAWSDREDKQTSISGAETCV